MATKPATTATDPQAKSTCACGCGESVERTFKQGHDQRLISRLASDLVHGDVWEGTCASILKRGDAKLDIQEKINKVSAYVASKLSPGLAAKFESAAARQWELQKGRNARSEAKAARRAEQANKPKRAKKATPSEEAGDAKLATVTPIDMANPPTVKATASNDDVDAAEAGLVSLGATVKAKIGRTIKEATVVAMNQSGKATVLEYPGRGGKTARTEKFEIVNG